MRITGFDEFRQKLDKLAKAAKKLDGEHEITLDQIFHPLFMLENTSFGSIEEFFRASSFTLETQQDFNAIDESTLDGYVREKTRFQSWQEMKQTAAQEWMTKQFKEECA